MDRRTFLLGFLGSLAAAPTIIATASSVEAASVPETLPPVSPPDPEPVSSGEAEVDLEKVEADWSQYGYRRRAYRRGYRRTYRRGYRRAYRRGYRRGYYPRAYYPRAYYRRPYRRHARRVSRRVYRRAYRRRY